jgi:hypothetical protein
VVRETNSQSLAIQLVEQVPISTNGDSLYEVGNFGCTESAGYFTLPQWESVYLPFFVFVAVEEFFDELSEDFQLVVPTISMTNVGVVEFSSCLVVAAAGARV